MKIEMKQPSVETVNATGDQRAKTGQAGHHFQRTMSDRLGRLLGLSNERLEQVLASGSFHRFRARSTVIVGPQGFSIVVTGAVRTTYVNGISRDKVVTINGPGDVLVDSCGFAQITGICNQAVVECTLFSISCPHFFERVLGVSRENLATSKNVVFERIFGVLGRYIRISGERLHSRLADVLLELAAKFGVDDARGTLLSLKISHDDLAGLIGCARPQVTTLLNDFEERDLIRRDGRQLILNVPELRQQGLNSSRVQDLSAIDKEA